MLLSNKRILLAALNRGEINLLAKSSGVVTSHRAANTFSLFFRIKRSTGGQGKRALERNFHPLCVSNYARSLLIFKDTASMPASNEILLSRAKTSKRGNGGKRRKRRREKNMDKTKERSVISNREKVLPGNKRLVLSVSLLSFSLLLSHIHSPFLSLFSY